MARLRPLFAESDFYFYFNGCISSSGSIFRKRKSNVFIDFAATARFRSRRKNFSMDSKLCRCLKLGLKMDRKFLEKQKY